MPHFAHGRVSSSAPSRSPSPAMLQPEPQLSKRAIVSRKAWPPFPPPQSLSDDTAQLHLTLRSPPPSHSPSPSPGGTPHLSRRPSSSGRATPDSDGPCATELLDPGNAGLAPSSIEGSSAMTDKHRSKKSNRLSTASIGSLLSASHDERKRKERKRTEKFVKHEQTLQELRTAERRRAYFRDASHRQELIFGPDVRTRIYPLHTLQRARLPPNHPQKVF